MFDAILFQENHKPSLDGGIVVKIDVNQRYATNSITSAVLRCIAAAVEEPLQVGSSLELIPI